MKTTSILWVLFSGLITAVPALAAVAPGSPIETSNTTRLPRSLETRFIVEYRTEELARTRSHWRLMDSSQRAEVIRLRTEALTRATGAHLSYVRPMAVSRRHLLKADRALSAPDTAAVLEAMMANDSAIQSIEVDQVSQVDWLSFGWNGRAPTPFWGIGPKPILLGYRWNDWMPIDPDYGQQWHYFESAAGINVLEAWETGKRFGSKGFGTIVAVLDTGYRPHPDLNANLLPGYDMISSVGVSNDGDGRDDSALDPGDHCGWRPSSWHGTHVAGTIAALGYNGQGGVGVAPLAKILPVRVLGKCGGYDSDIAAGIIWASGGHVPGVPINNSPADVINISLGANRPCPNFMQAAINTARSNGATIVVSAGNGNVDVRRKSPANCEGVIAVAALDRGGERAYYSNYGDMIDIAAPGGTMAVQDDPNGVYSLSNSGTTAPENDAYAFLAGTSMAAPHVSAVLALMYGIDNEMTPDRAEQVIKSTARPSGCSNCGSGLVDPIAALQMIDPVLLKTGNLSGSRGSWKRYEITVPDGVDNLSVSLSSTALFWAGNPDLYIRYGSAPSLTAYDCRPYTLANTENCRMTNPEPGLWYIGIYGRSAYSSGGVVASVNRR